MAMDEKALNAFIAQAMELQAPRGYLVQAEQHGQARYGNTSPDMVVRMPYGLRTIVETEYGAPALGDAKSRLGYEFNDYMPPMKSVLAVGIPRHLGNLGREDRDRELMGDEPQFLMQVVTGRSENDPDIKITPAQPVAVSLRDLVQYAWLAAIPEAYATEILNQVVANLTTAQTELSQRLRLSSPETQVGLVERYGNHDNANGMDSVAGNVVGTLASMIQLHINLKQWGNVNARDIAAPELWQRVDPHNGIPERIAAEWRKIETVDYMPLSTIAAGMLEDSELGPRLGSTLKAVRETMSGYLRAGISATTNVAAEIWQALIPDRDQRAAYYTKPAVAELLANLTTVRLESPAAANYNEICAGTGTLARATEENIRFRHYANPDNSKDSIHAKRMERCIQLTDINPQSISVATANMTSLEPETGFGSSSIFAITAAGGSLNFLTREGVAGMEDELVGRNGAQSEMLVIDPRTVEIICNNDPYFRPRGGAKSPIGSDAMQAYRRHANRRVKGVANGQAGLATFMHVIEHEMLSYECPHGKVLPLTAARSDAYKGFRQNIENEYCDVIAISTASGDGASMSADTGIQEMLLIGTKHRVPSGMQNTGQYGDRAITCVNLHTTFESKLQAKMFADAIRREVAAGLSSGEIDVGGVVGTYYRMTGLGEGKPWSALGTGGEYTTLTERVTGGAVWNSATNVVTEFALPMTTLGQIAVRGPGDDLIGKVAKSRSPRGAFVIHAAKNTPSLNNSSMWAVDAATQVNITCTPTHYGVPYGTEQVINQVRSSAGQFHLCRNLRMSAQKIAVCYTESDCIGGRAWTTISSKPGVAESIAVFLNSTYGMIVRVGYGEATDLGRSTMGVSAVDGHPIPDFASKSNSGRKARRIAVENFDRLRKLPLQRISLSALDANRAEIDRVVTLMLGLDWNPETENMLAAWRRLMCLQPGVNANNREVLATLAKAGIRG